VFAPECVEGNVMNAMLRSFSVLAALSLTGAAYAQTQVAPDTPSVSVTTPTLNPELAGASTAPRSGAIRMAAVPGNVDSGMQVKSPAGAVLGRVASIVPSDSNRDGYVVIADLQGVAVPVPYRAASAMVHNDTLVIDESRLANAPKVQQYQAEDGPSDVWERKADGYWKRSAARAPDEPSGVRHE
jgi:hypothetical protein